MGPQMAEVTSPPWLNVRRGNAPLLLCMPHTGTQIPAALAPAFRSAWLARRDTDWYVERLYSFAEGLDATLVRTEISRSVIDANRDPSGASLYPGQATTELCPTTTFDGEPLYRRGPRPGAGADRRAPQRLLRALPRRHRRRDRPAARAPCARGPLRLPLDPFADPAPVRGTPAAPESRHLLRGELRPGARRTHRSVVRRERLLAHHQRPLQGWVHDAPLRAAAGGRTRGADGARLPRLCARAPRGGPRGQLAAALG